MPILLVVFIWASVFGIAIAGYLWMRERSRRDVMERTLGFPVADARRLIRSSTVKPMDARVEKVLKKAPSVWSESVTIQKQLVFAGFDSPYAPAVYATARVVAIVLLPILAVILLPPTSFAKAFVEIVAAAFIGLLLPVAYLLRAVRMRQERIRRSLPDALDLLVICVEAGISLDAAVLRVARDMGMAHPDLARELMIVNRKSNAGMTREESFRGLWERTGVEEIRTLVSSLIQSEKWGTSSSRVLRISSETLRRKRRHNAEKRAATAPIKMVVPMALLIFPALFVVILGPAVLKIVETFSGT
jgi:tight adherence protein C